MEFSIIFHGSGGGGYHSMIWFLFFWTHPLVFFTSGPPPLPGTPTGSGSWLSSTMRFLNLMPKMDCPMSPILICWVFVGWSSGIKMDLGDMLCTTAWGSGGRQRPGMTSCTWRMPWGSGWGRWSWATSRGRWRGKVVLSCTTETRLYRHYASSQSTGTTPNTTSFVFWKYRHYAFFFTGT